MPPAVSDVAQLRAELDRLRAAVHQSDDEIDALQVGLARTESRANRPWYREGSLIVAVLALLFSFGTTAASYARLDQEDRQQDRDQLTAYIQRLGELPRLAAELQLTHGDDATSGVLGVFTAESELIANQAVTVMERIPDRVGSIEYLTVGMALIQTGALEQAEELLGRALAVAGSPIERITALRSLADLRYVVGDVAGGREFNRQARAVFADTPVESQQLVAITDATTEIRWGFQELGAGECAEARRHLDEAARVAGARPPASIVALLGQLRRQVATTCP